MRTRSAIILSVTLLLGASASTSAHRRDEYLQASRLAITPTRVDLQIDLTPGIAIADAIIAEIDRNRDGVVSADEQRAYVETVLRALRLDVDGGAIPLPIRLVSSSFPALEAFTRGEGTIALHAEATLPAASLAAGPHTLAYHNALRPDLGAYLANALVPDTDRIAIQSQHRDVDQRELTIDYVLRDGPAFPVARTWLLACVALAVAWTLFLIRTGTSRPADRSAGLARS